MNPKQKSEPNNDQPSAEYAAFDKALGRALSVPKAEIDRREAEWRQKQQAKKQKPKP